MHINHGFIKPRMQVESDWREPIPFFKNRIENTKRFSDGKIINYHTDPFKMICVE